MQFGRVGKARKTKLLHLSAILCFVLAMFFILISFLYFKRYDLWFYLFSLFVGAYLLSKFLLFHLDSSCYFGSLLFFIGVTGILRNLLGLDYFSVLVFFSFALASFLTFLFFRQNFHLFIGNILTYEGIILYLFLVNIINFNVFLILNAILLFIFLFICAIIFRKPKQEA